MEELQNLVLEWAETKGLLEKENCSKQTMKLVEEVGELCSAILKNKKLEQVDALGDIQVVLIILAKQLDIDYNKSLQHAYDIIKHRTGQTINGTFIKNE